MTSDTDSLHPYHRRYLRSLAHPLKPIIFVGRRGLTAELTAALSDALAQHELIKVKFLEPKSSAEKLRITELLSKATKAHVVGTVGHVVIFFRQNEDPDKQRVTLPRRPTQLSYPHPGGSQAPA